MTQDPTFICTVAVALAVLLMTFWRVILCMLAILGITVFLAGFFVAATALQGVSP